MNKVAKAGIVISNGFIKGIIIKLFHSRETRVSLYAHISPFTEITIDRGGRLEYGKRLILRSGTKLRVRNNGAIILGKNVGIGNRCMIVAHDQIVIGDGTIIGPNVMIYDHDHDYNSEKPAKEFVTSPIIIGKNVWIGSNVIILKGTEIGDNCVIAAGTILKGKYESDKIIYQERTIKIKEKKKHE